MKNVRNGVKPDAQAIAPEGFRQPSATYIATLPPAMNPKNDANWYSNESAEREHDPHACRDAEEQKQQRADAGGDGRSRVGVGDPRVQAEHRREGGHHELPANQEDTSFSVDSCPTNHR